MAGEDVPKAMGWDAEADQVCSTVSLYGSSIHRYVDVWQLHATASDAVAVFIDISMSGNFMPLPVMRQHVENDVW